MRMAAEQNQADPKTNGGDLAASGKEIIKGLNAIQACKGPNLKKPQIKPNRSEIEPGPFYKTFTISFHYLKRFHRLTVMKVSRAYAGPIYKIVLSSALKSNGWVCWLQQQSKSWSLLLGNGIDEKLIATIGLAIEYHQ
jgi:hypothetical protein